MGLLDNITKTAQGLTQNIIGSIKSDATNSQKEEEMVTLQDGTKMAKKDIPYGEIYINEKGQTVRKLMKQPVAIESKQQMQQWLHQLSPYASPAISIALENQLQVLDNVFSASLAGMTIDNMLFSLQKALQYTYTEDEKNNLRDNFCMMIQNFVFINEAKILYTSEQNRLEAANLLGQAGAKMMVCAVNIGMEVVKNAQVRSVAKEGKAAANTIAKKITTSDIPPITKNPFEGEDAEKMLGELAKSLAKKKILEEKKMEFDKMMMNLFPMFDRYSEMIGPSVLVTGLLERYVFKLVEQFEVKKYTGILSRIKDFRPPKRFLKKTPPTDYEYARALEIEISAEAKAAANALKLEREELEEYRSELKKITFNPLKGSRRAELNAKISEQERVVKQQRDTAEIAENTRYKLEQILLPVKTDVEEYRKRLMRVVEKYDIIK